MIRKIVKNIPYKIIASKQIITGNEKKAIDTQSYTTNEIVRIARIGFDLAKKRSKLNIARQQEEVERGNLDEVNEVAAKLTSVEKANVMETGKFWREIVTELHQKEFSDVELHHMYADNCAMQLIRFPKQFDVIVTDNLFGDILSDCAAMLTGSLGMLPSASLGAADNTGRRAGMYEPVHGSAPDISGQDKANPIAMIMSFAMMLKYSFDMQEESDLIEKAIENVLSKGLRTLDIQQQDTKYVSTKEMGSAIIQELDILIGSWGYYTCKCFKFFHIIILPSN